MKTRIISIFIILIFAGPDDVRAAVCPTDTIYNYDFSGDSSRKRLTGRTIYQYGPGERVDNFLMQEWDSVKRVFVNLKNVSSTYNSSGFETLKLFENWDKVKNSWVNSGRYLNVYDSKMKVIDYKYYIWNVAGNKWEGATHVINQYDSTGNKTETVTERWDNSKSVWYNYWRETFAYNNAGSRTEYVTYSWPVGSSEWFGEKKYTFDFDDKNLLVAEYGLRWIPAEGSWDTTGKSEYEYNSKGQKIIYTGRMHFSSEWKNFNRSFYSYNIEGLLSETLQETADPNGIDTFMFYSSTINEYDANSNMTSETFSVWNIKSDTYIFRNRILNSYNQYNKQLSYEYQNWDTSSKVWAGQHRYRYYYLNDTNLTATIHDMVSETGKWQNVYLNRYEFSPQGKQIAQDKYSEWDNDRAYFKKHIRDEYLCKKSPDNSRIINREIKTISIYPNPLSGNTITIETKEAGHYLLSDVSGNILLTGYFKTGINELNTLTLCNGIYFIVIEGKAYKLIINHIN